MEAENIKIHIINILMEPKRLWLRSLGYEHKEEHFVMAVCQIK